MIVKQAGNAVEVWTPAKLNLFLEILRRRDDGFHEIETLMSPIAWLDTLTFQPNDSGQLTLDCRWTRGIEARRNCERLPSDCQAYAELPPAAENLVMRAAKLVQEEEGIEQGADIRLLKRIPAAAGLGGASSDCAATIVAACLAWKLDWSLEQMSEIASRLGSDVPFFLSRQSAVCRGRGELIEPFATSGVRCYVIVKPAAGLSTAAVFEQCRPPTEAQRVDRLQRALESGPQGIEPLLFNRMEEAALAVQPELAELPRKLEQISKSRSLMSGSGTSHFVPCRNARHARRTAALARGRGLGAVCCSVSADRGTSRTVRGQYST